MFLKTNILAFLVVGLCPGIGASQTISPEQREAMGLKPVVGAGNGKVHPEVYRDLDEEKPYTRPVEGTAWVQVQLTYTPCGQALVDERNIKELQKRVLGRLTATDFHLCFSFRTRPGMLGWASRDGLRKLSSDADVAAICLDDKPRPQDLPHARAVNYPPSPTTSQRSGKVEASVYQALTCNEHVFVIVNFDQADDKRNTVLSRLTAAEFLLRSKPSLPRDIRGTPHVAGYVSAAGLAKLEADSAVTGIGLTREVRAAPIRRGR